NADRMTTVLAVSVRGLRCFQLSRLCSSAGPAAGRTSSLQLPRHLKNDKARVAARASSKNQVTCNHSGNAFPACAGITRHRHRTHEVETEHTPHGVRLSSLTGHGPRTAQPAGCRSRKQTYL